GVLAAGGLLLVFPTISLGEVFMNPTSLMFRNLMAMDTEEMIRAQPMDAVVLVGGCDKTVPAQLMGAISANRPAIGLVAGPMMTSRWHGERLGACTDCRRFWAKYRAGEIETGEIHEIEGNLATTAGTCAVMGTASTMASIAEALGMILPGTAAIPAVHADRLRAAEATGRAAMRLAASGLTPDRIVTAQSVENALRVLMAIGGSTNSVLHPTAIPGPPSRCSSLSCPAVGRAAAAAGGALRAVRLIGAERRNRQAVARGPEAVREGRPRTRPHLPRRPLGPHRRPVDPGRPRRLPGIAE